jgi:hypothetical protein
MPEKKTTTANFLQGLSPEYLTHQHLGEGKNARI